MGDAVLMKYKTYVRYCSYVKFKSVLFVDFRNDRMQLLLIYHKDLSYRMYHYIVLDVFVIQLFNFT